MLGTTKNDRIGFRKAEILCGFWTGGPMVAQVDQLGLLIAHATEIAGGVFSERHRTMM